MGIFGRRKRDSEDYADDYADGYDDQDADYDDSAEYADDDELADEYADEYNDTDYVDDGPEEGPYDEDEVPNDGIARLDLGSVRLPMPEGARVQVEMDPAGPLRAVHVVTDNGRHTVSAYAAPRSSALWNEVARELSGQLHNDGARVRKENGPFGIELVAFVNNVLLRFVGVDGPRWMLRAVAAGPKDVSAKAAEELRDIVRGTVVARGKHPMPVRTPLPLTLPDEIAQHLQAAQQQQQPVTGQLPLPGQPLPGQPMGGQLPNQPMPGQPLPGQPMPGQPTSGQPMPGQPLPGQLPGQGPLPGRRVI